MTGSISYRLARIGDAQRVAAMSRDLIERGLGWRWTPRRVAAHIRHPDSLVVVAGCEGQFAGFAMMHFGERFAHLNLLAVAPRARRRGVGSGLVRWLEASAWVAGTMAIRLELRAGNRQALQFYHSLGYEEVARVPGYYGGREAAIRMIRILRLPTGPAQAVWQPPPRIAL
jgi:ribosomal-protein-alanine N-acetyltransferase